MVIARGRAVTFGRIFHEVEWLAKTIVALATAPDTGVGDTIKRLLGILGNINQALFNALTGTNYTGCGFRSTK